MQAFKCSRGSCTDVFIRAFDGTASSDCRRIGLDRYLQRTRLNGVWLVDRCIWMFYVYLSGCTNVSQICQRLGTKCQRCKSTVLLNFWACLLVCG